MPVPRIYQINKNDTARYVMGDFESNPLCVLGLNPSKASLQKLDVTVSKVKKFAENMGFDGWIMINIYPQRSTLPENIHKRRNKKLISDNSHYIKKVLQEISSPTVWAAWGNLIDHRPFFPNCLKNIHENLSDLNPNWIHIGTLTKSGHPRHPSRMAYDNPTYTFDIEAYLRNLDSN